MDLNAHLRAAVPRVLEQRPAGRVHVVSGGLDWCRARMGWIEEELGVPVTFDRETDPPLATASRSPPHDASDDQPPWYY